MKKPLVEKRLFLGLELLQLFISIAVIPSGIMFILDPSGEPWG